MWNAEYRPLKLVEEHRADAHARGEAGTASGQREAKH
jgi:malate dehydrogenase (oxaloacetate-decarboxylating)